MQTKTRQKKFGFHIRFILALLIYIGKLKYEIQLSTPIQNATKKCNWRAKGCFDNDGALNAYFVHISISFCNSWACRTIQHITHSSALVGICNYDGISISFRPQKKYCNFVCWIDHIHICQTIYFINFTRAIFYKNLLVNSIFITFFFIIQKEMRNVFCLVKCW